MLKAGIAFLRIAAVRSSCAGFTYECMKQIATASMPLSRSAATRSATAASSSASRTLPWMVDALRHGEAQRSAPPAAAASRWSGRTGP